MRRIAIVVGAVSFTVMAGGGTALAEPSLHPSERISASPVSAENPSPERPLVAVAHRGASGHAPENTLAAIEAAGRLGAETVEVDVQLTSDGEPVLMHDTSLERTTDIEEVHPDLDSYDVGDLTLEQIEQVEAGSWFDPVFEGEPVPTLSDALDTLESLDLNLFLEVKDPETHPGIEETLAEELSSRDHWMEQNPAWEPRRLVVESFDWDSMEESKDLMPSVSHGLLGEVPEDELGDYEWSHMVNPNHEGLTSDYVEAVHEAGYEIMPYTINDQDRMVELLELGVDGFVTDYPDVGQEAIAEFEGAAHQADAQDGDPADELEAEPAAD
ncbi:glycerophosphodiester phosphodiesterase [Nocardiopsis salina]|uniref:glycerophosphodiester phosphodiesterase n=1 Tax=Nocardiopsis salina TaxID=245836 RepID=UPI0003456590|nr:glycerophosphodiester phosphodiesterase family protein [Nocardiopsis salina]